MNRSRRLRSLLVLVGLVLFGAGCDEKIGELTFYNDSDETVLFLEAGGEDATLEDAVRWSSHNPVSLDPGRTDRATFDDFSVDIGRPGAHDPWCPRMVYFVVRSKSGRDYDSNPIVEDPPLEASDLEILEQLGPGWCWPGRVVEYHYTGE